MLTECPECKRAISDRARTCPQCGFPLVGTGDPGLDYQIRRLKGGRIFTLLTAFGCAIWLLGLLLTSASARQGDRETAFVCMILSIVGFTICHMRIKYYEKMDIGSR